MIVAFSTSSRLASVALLSLDKEVIWAGTQDAPRAASGACLDLLKRGLSASGMQLEDAKLFAADLGPGSFTGVRVGVTLAKTLAHLVGAETYGATAFDLIDPDGVVVLPSKRGEWFVRRPGQDPIRVDQLDDAVGKGYGSDLCEPNFPTAEGFSKLLIPEPLPPEKLVPAYLIPPSISTPKKPFGGEVAR